MFKKIVLGPLFWVVVISGAVFFGTKSILLSSIAGSVVLLISGFVKGFKYALIAIIATLSVIYCIKYFG